MAVRAPKRRISRRRRRLTLPPAQSPARPSRRTRSARHAPDGCRAAGGGGGGGGGGGSPSGTDPHAGHGRPALLASRASAPASRSGARGPGRTGRRPSTGSSTRLGGSDRAAGDAQRAADRPPRGQHELVLAWVGRMVSASNPLVERLTFFWHRHWACSRDDVDLLFMASRTTSSGATPTWARIRSRLPQPRLRGRRGPGDAPLPERRAQPPRAPERELRARADGALLPRRHRRRPAIRTTPSPTSGSSRGRSPAGDRHGQPEQSPRRLRPVPLRQRLEDFLGRSGQLQHTPGRRHRARTPGAPGLHRPQALVRVRRRRSRRRHARRPHGDLHGQRASAQAAAAQDPDAPAAVRLPRRADPDQAAGRLCGGCVPPARPECRQHEPVHAAERDGTAPATSRPTSRAGSTARPS